MNVSGITPTRYFVLIDPVPVEEKTDGGVILPEKAREKAEFATTRGRIIEASPLAFTFATPDEWGETRKPSAGDLVLYEKYAGTKAKGKDGKEYVLLKDESIVATLEE